MSAELERHKPDLHIAENQSRAASIPELFSALLDALTQRHTRDGELHQLWLEANWLKGDFDKKVFAMPKHWELLMFKIRRGEISANLLRHPEVIRRVIDLVSALEEHLSTTDDQTKSG